MATWAGVVYVAFVVDTFARRIVGWSAATSKETRLVLDALEMALWQRDRDEHPHVRGELIHHSNALMESTIGLFKTELIKPHGPGRPSPRSSWPPQSGSTGTATADSTVR
nr:DDE-type integrase/transposase/recombinase [Streptomyces sp. AC512_CC834]